MLEVDQTAKQWTLRLEGRIQDGLTEEQALQSDQKFLQLFEKIKIEFIDDKGQPYPKYMPVVWQKNKSAAGDQFDCIRVQREFLEESACFKVRLSLWLDQSPRRFVLSEQLHKILGIQEETRAKVVAALWQYIKQNRLQDSDDRRFIILNSELQDLLFDVFNCEDRIEFHQIIGLLKSHLQEPRPTQFVFEAFKFQVAQGPEKKEARFFDMAVNVHSAKFKKALKFLYEHNYTFTRNENKVQGAKATELRKREAK